MTPSDFIQRVTSATVPREGFAARVGEEAEALKTELRDGAFDNPDAAVGIEYECYAVDAASTALRRVPRSVLLRPGVETELGIHNAELHASPQPLSAAGLRAQLAALRARFEAGVTPAAWKRREVRRRADDGATLADAIHGTQAAYVERQADTFLDGSFADWLGGRPERGEPALA